MGWSGAVSSPDSSEALINELWEQALLAGFLAYPSALPDHPMVTPELFGRIAHGECFSMVSKLAGTVPDRELGFAISREKPQLRQLVLTLTNNAPVPGELGFYVDELLALARQRWTVERTVRYAQRVAVPGVDLASLTTEYVADLVSLSESSVGGRDDLGVVLLDALLAEEDHDVHYRVDRLLPVGGRVLFAAQFKAGKTTADHNLVRSLVDGVPFLGEFEVTAPAGRVTILDTELDRDMLKRWLRVQGIHNTNRVAVFPLRGRVSTFNIIDAEVRRQWVCRLQDLDTSILVLDCLRPVLDSIGLSEDKDAGQFLVAFDELLNQANIAEAVVIHHMGHNGERSRGSSRLRDWPDAEWKLVRGHTDEDNPAAPRYFSAYGRDVDVSESALAYDAEKRHLYLAGTGDRKDAAARKAVTAVLAWLEDNPGASGYAVDRALAESEGQKLVRDALARLVADGRVRTAKGARNATLHYPVTSSPRPPRHDLVDKVATTSSTSSIGRGGGSEINEVAAADEVRSFSEPLWGSDD